MTEAVLRRERPGENAVVADVVRQTFGDDGNHVAGLVDALRESSAWLGESFVAERAGTVVAQVMFTRSLLDAPRRLVDVLVLSPLGVLPREQRRGVGTALVRYALAELEARPEPLVFLEGSPTYYPRFGFRPAGTLGFRKPSLRSRTLPSRCSGSPGTRGG